MNEDTAALDSPVETDDLPVKEKRPVPPENERGNPEPARTVDAGKIESAAKTGRRSFLKGIGATALGVAGLASLSGRAEAAHYAVVQLGTNASFDKSNLNFQSHPVNQSGSYWHRISQVNYNSYHGTYQPFTHAILRSSGTLQADAWAGMEFATQGTARAASVTMGISRPRTSTHVSLSGESKEGYGRMAVELWDRTNNQLVANSWLASWGGTVSGSSSNLSQGQGGDVTLQATLYPNRVYGIFARGQSDANVYSNPGHAEVKQYLNAGHVHINF